MAPLIRILLRYAAMALVTRGLISDDAGAILATDPDVQLVVGALIGFATEAWYVLARRLGWSK
ncbi:MAG: hypothetical protein KDJ17_08155 [Hyphomicrobiaceae bacterium]|nr:hypothetical protein [Hyphomicrobiaceae bacterium]